jgi:hypothetical protein
MNEENEINGIRPAPDGLFARFARELFEIARRRVKRWFLSEDLKFC